MRSKSMMRQVALASYGTAFLRQERQLDDWYRHGIFSGARMLFRATDGNTLLADDFTLWLGTLKAAGAVRLTLHLAAELSLAVPGASEGGDLAIAVHYREHYEWWVVGDERATWAERPRADDEDRSFPWFPNAAAYAGDIDTYWIAGKVTGRLDVPATHWKSLTAAAAAELDIAIPSTRPTGPLVVPMGEARSWAELPLFPYSRDTGAAHHLLATLYSQQQKFANDTNMKNENSFYKSLDQAGADRVDEWGRLLDSWVTRVELCCANECGDVLATRKPILVEPAERPAQPASEQPLPALESSGADGGNAPLPVAPDEKRSGRPGKWTGRIASIVVMAVVSLLTLAVANLIALHPWLSLLIGLPFALYAHYKQKDK